MVKSRKFIEDFIKTVKPQIEKMLWESRALSEDDAIVVWVQKNCIEFSALCGDGIGYKEKFTYEDGKLFSEVTISKKVEVADDGGDVG